VNEWESFQKIDSNFVENSKEWKLTGEQAEYNNGFKMSIHQRKDNISGRKDDIMRGHGSYKGTSVDELVAFFTDAASFPGMLEWTEIDQIENGFVPDQKDKIIYYRVKAPLCNVRDNVLKIHIDKREDGSTFVCMRSWNHVLKPAMTSPIRVFMTN
tara:strand:- start:27 stop:494 length:468 start_codon:yes stop_codon:yes gene_type:complete